MPLPDIIRRSGARMVTLIREPDPTEQRSEIEAPILNDQGADKAYVATETPVYEGDIIEWPILAAARCGSSLRRSLSTIYPTEPLPTWPSPKFTSARICRHARLQ